MPACASTLQLHLRSHSTPTVTTPTCPASTGSAGHLLQRSISLPQSPPATANMSNHITSPPFRPRARASSATFNLPSDSDSDTSDDVPLPFPAALPRSDFLVTDFQPAAYLSALPHRHQTLEDLRSDLRERSTAISSELLELVNSNYTAFLSLGSELRGGDEKVENVKVALLGFRRAVEEVKGRVAGRKEDTRALNDELRDVRSNIEQGRKMLDLSDRLSSLEERLALDSMPATNGDGDWDADDSDDNEEDEDENVEGLLESPPAKLLESAQECDRITKLADRLDQDHAFVIKMQERLTRCRNTLLLDLGNALREAKGAGAKGQGRVLKYLTIYRILDAQSDAIKALRGG